MPLSRRARIGAASAATLAAALLGLWLLSGGGLTVPEGFGLPGGPGGLREPRPGPQAQTLEGGGVTVTLTPIGGPRFRVQMVSAAGPLDEYNLIGLATLADSAGNRVAPSSWERSGFGRHIVGTLTFPASGPSGALDLTGPVSVTVAAVGGVDRTFRWERGVLG